jgi:hypothetical protein
MRFVLLALCSLAIITPAFSKELKKPHGFEISNARPSGVKFVYFDFTDKTTGDIVERKFLAKKGVRNAINKAVDAPTELAEQQCLVDLKFEFDDGSIVESPSTDICSIDEILVE